MKKPKTAPSLVDSGRGRMARIARTEDRISRPFYELAKALWVLAQEWTDVSASVREFPTERLKEEDLKIASIISSAIGTVTAKTMRFAAWSALEKGWTYQRTRPPSEGLFPSGAR